MMPQRNCKYSIHVRSIYIKISTQAAVKPLYTVLFGLQNEGENILSKEERNIWFIYSLFNGQLCTFYKLNAMSRHFDAHPLQKIILGLTGRK